MNVGKINHRKFFHLAYIWHGFYHKIIWFVFSIGNYNTKRKFV